MAAPPSPARPGPREQLLGLDTRFWIVNAMEMLERLAYYGVRAVVALYMVLPVEQGGPEFTHVQKGTIFAWWAAVQSLLPTFTGGLADRYGHKRTIAAAIVLKVIGYGLMAHMTSYAGFFTGCLFLAAGTAIFKPGVQGTLASTLRGDNASVGWGVFYQLVNIGGFLGPVLAGVLRLMDWSFVFWACAGIVALNFLWLPFYDDPTREGPPEERSDPRAWAQLASAVGTGTARSWFLAFAAATLVALGLRLAGTWTSWTPVIGCGFFALAFGWYLRHRPRLLAGLRDPWSVLVVSIVGLFQHRVLFFCLVFSGFWLMFNQVFDLLPNVIDDWVDTSGLIGAAGRAFASPAVPTVLAVLGGLVVGGLGGVIAFLALRPDRRPPGEAPAGAWFVAGLGTSLPVGALLDAASLPAGWALPLGVLAAWAARRARLPARPFLGGMVLLGGVGGAIAIRSHLLASSAALLELAREGGQVNPEWMINLNPAIIVFTMVFFAWLSSFVRPLTSITVGMAIATAGSVVAGTAAVGAVCLAGIAIFSVGEMLSSPKKMEYLASLARRGQEGLFMGYANVPVAIGWISGSVFANNRYEVAGDKANLARRYLVEHLGMAADRAAAIPRGEVVQVLADALGRTPWETTGVLRATYHPEQLWWTIAAIGLSSVVGMIVYDRVIRHVDRRAYSSSEATAADA